jgi:hypothetical protein
MLSDRIIEAAKRGWSEQSIAKALRTPLATVQLAVAARKIIDSLAPLVAKAERQLSTIDGSDKQITDTRRGCGVRLKQERRRHHLTQAALASILELPPSWISDFERGRGPRSHHYKVVSALHCSGSRQAHSIDARYVEDGERRQGLTP